MRKFLILAFLPLFVSGTTARVKAPAVTICPCKDSIDTVLPDSLKASVAQAAFAKVDSFEEAKQRWIDSMSAVNDSLEREIKILINEKRKKRTTRSHKVYKLKYEP